MTIQGYIMEFLLKNGASSKTKICDHVREANGTLGETTGRALRLMIEAGILKKETRSFQGEDYVVYAIVPLEKVEIPDSYKKAEEENKEQELPL